MQYSFFIGFLYFMVSGLVLNITFCFYVGYSFQNNRFDHVWWVCLTDGIRVEI